MKGSRELPGAGDDDFTRLRRTGNHALTWVANRIFGTSYTDITFGYNGYWRTAIRDPRPSPTDSSSKSRRPSARAKQACGQQRSLPTKTRGSAGSRSSIRSQADSAILSVILAEHPRRVAELRSSPLLRRPECRIATSLRG